MLLPTEELIFAPSQESEERCREHDLRLEAVRLHHRTAGEQVVELVGATELDVSLDRHRVVRLHERVEELGDRDRLAGRDALREVVSLEKLRDGQRPGQPHDVCERELREPFAVEPHLGAVGVEDLHRLVDVCPGIRIDLLVREDRPFGGAPRGIADPGRVVADDEDADVPCILESPHPLKGDRPADVDVGRGDVDPELDA